MASNVLLLELEGRGCATEKKDHQKDERVVMEHNHCLTEPDKEETRIMDVPSLTSIWPELSINHTQPEIEVTKAYQRQAYNLDLRQTVREPSKSLQNMIDKLAAPICPPSCSTDNHHVFLAYDPQNHRFKEN